MNIGMDTVIVMASSTPRVHLFELLPNENTCLDDNNKLAPLGVQCQKVSQNFNVGADFKALWVLIENDRAVCKTSKNGSRIDGVYDPSSPACIYVERLSAPTGSSISVTTEVGSIRFTPTVVHSQPEALAFFFTVTASHENEEPVTGILEVLVTTPKTNFSVSKIAGLTDPVN
ncbi:hypothetical protein MNBD_GAMMA04-2272 [hydrothermal vent metagenome]|uniref:Uncharacterized protein n=1 Tax=hydrothermal vent metagenome TaxID=652676 RepID=A0A3B0W4D7_9ZZZZ